MRMKYLRILFLTILVGFLVVGSSWAVPFLDGGAALQDVINDITTAPTSGVSSIDVTTDLIDDDDDSYWNITASGSSSATMIIEIAGYANSNVFGVYDYITGKTVQLFDGSAASGNQVTLSVKDATMNYSVFLNNSDTNIDFSSGTFGYYIDSSSRDGGGIFYSDTTMNEDNSDHMVALQGNNIDTLKLPGVVAGTWTDNEFILAFEDLSNGANSGYDGDFNDMVLMVESVAPVPEPATMLLLGAGLIGLAGFGRKRFL